MRHLNRTLLLALMALTCLQAQDITKGAIAGVVRDASGAVVPGAPVRLTSPFGDRETTTNSGGAYSFHEPCRRPWLRRHSNATGIFGRHTAQYHGGNQWHNDRRH